MSEEKIDSPIQSILHHEDVQQDFSININPIGSPNTNSNDKDEIKSTTSNNFSSVRLKIINDIIAPSFYDDVKGTISARKKWRSASNKIETLSKILAGSSTIVAFASGVYQYQYLSFIAGCLGTIGIVAQQFATYASKESQERTEQANKILKTLNINQLDDLVEDNQ